MRAVWPHILPVWSTVTCHYQPGAHWAWEGSGFPFFSTAISYLPLLHSFLSVSYFPSLCLSRFSFQSSLFLSLSLCLLCFFSFTTVYAISFCFHEYLLIFLSLSLVCCSSSILSFLSSSFDARSSVTWKSKNYIRRTTWSVRWPAVLPTTSCRDEFYRNPKRSLKTLTC